MSERTSVTLNISDETKHRLDNVIDRHAMKVGLAAARLIEWFVQQDPDLQAIILGHIQPKRAIDLLDLIRKELEVQERAKLHEKRKPG
jgi:hypothetical protein